MTLEATHRFVLLLGGSLSLIVIPTAISWRRRAFLKRCVCVVARRDDASERCIRLQVVVDA